MEHANQSEVARVRHRIQADYEAAKSAMHELAQGTCTHLFITTRTEHMAVAIAELVLIAGEDAMIATLKELE